MIAILLLAVLGCAAWHAVRPVLKVAHGVPRHNDDMVFV